MTGLPWREFSDFLRDHFPGKMQKLAVNAGFTCPNRDGTLGRGGCTYCINTSFNPAYCAGHESVTAQLERGKAFFSRKYPAMRYLAYFQAYTNTHHRSVAELMALYDEALAVEGVDGLIIATRPDCVTDELLAALSRRARSRFVMIEFGAESSHDATLRLVNRCHTWACTVDAVTRTAARGIHVGLHFIMGLPGETRAMMMETVNRINSLPVATVKFHQLQVLRGTRLAAQVAAGEVAVEQFSVEAYADICAEIVRALRPDIAIDRFVSQSPPEMLISPRWGLKNHEFTALVRGRLA